MNLIEYLPEFMAKIEEFGEITRCEQPYFDSLSSDIDFVCKELFADSAGEYGLGRFEQVLGIEKTSDDMELRRFVIITRLRGAVREDIESKIKNIVGENNYNIDYDVDNMYLEVRITVKSKEYLSAVKNMLEDTVPCNIRLDIRLLYASHMMISDKTHEFLGQFKNEEIKLIGIEL